MFKTLYADYGYRRPVRSWNAVDVKNDAGMLKHGTVIDVRSDGLVIDFGFEGQRSELVPFGSAYHYFQGGELTTRCKVLVLLRDGPQCPWVWRPAILLTAEIPDWNARLAFVELGKANNSHRAVVGYQQIRRQPSEAELNDNLIHNNEFCRNPLPAALAGQLPVDASQLTVFWQQLSYVSRVDVVSSEEVLLLQRSANYPRTQSQLENLLREARQNVEAGMQKGAALGQIGWNCGFPLVVGGLFDGTADEMTLLDVHHHVLQEMVTYLDTIERVQQQPVSHAYNALLADGLSVHIRITFRRCRLHVEKFCRSCSQHNEDYRLAVPLLQCITTRTRSVTLVYGGPYILTELLLTLGICANKLRSCAKGQLSVVAIRSDLGHEDDDSFWDSAETLDDSMAGGWCRRLRFLECTMVSRLPGVRFSGTLLGSRRTEQLGQLIETQLPAIHVPRLAQWLAHVVGGHLPEWDDIRRILYEFTSPDPRTSSVYAGYEWTIANLTASCRSLPDTCSAVESRLMLEGRLTLIL